MPQFNKKKIIVFSLIAVFIILVALVVYAKKLPDKKEINVPFTSQAPAGDWSEPWQDACEETSIYMVSSFYNNDQIKRDQAIQQIKQIFAVKNKDFKVSKDESLQTIADLIKALGLPWTTTIVYGPTLDQIKTELAANRPIIVPVFAPALTNTDGPDYHVMVLIGYDDDKKEFIVNDPGTKNGQAIRFPYDKFMGAIHDLDAKDYQAGKKAVMFTQQNGWQNLF